MKSQNIPRAFAAVKEFLRSPHSALGGLIAASNIGRISDARIRAGQDRPETVAFHLTDAKGEGQLCHCHPAAFATLALAVTFGQSVIIDRRAQGKRPYVKVGGKMKSSAGIVFARVVLGVAEGEAVSYENEDSLDLRYANLFVSKRRPKANRTEIDVYGELLLSAAQRAEHLFPGTQGQRFGEAKALLESALLAMHGERAVAQ